MIAFKVLARGVGTRAGVVAIAGVLASLALALATGACGSILGIDSGTPRGDASTGGPEQDVAVMEPADAASADGGSSNDGASSDGGFPFSFDAEAGCAPDLDWCNTHCGTGPDNCGQPRACPTECGSGASFYSCNANNVCECSLDPNWCVGRCGQTKDNCGNTVVCAGCAPNVMCYSGVCGCMPDPVATTCGSQQCGQATNNCGLPVPCGVNDSPACANGQVCQSATNTCCTPDNAAACGAQCQVSVVNNCGQTVACPSTCPNNGACLQGKCCTPTSCVGNCVDNCGQSNAACCAPPPDSGSPPPDGGPPDGGSCAGGGYACGAGCCPGLLCGFYGSCVPMCGEPGKPCSQSSDCCYKLTCSSGIIVTSSSPQNLMPFDGGIQQLGTCQ